MDTSVIALGAAAVAGLLVFVPITSGVRFEQAMLVSNPGDGEYLLPWLVLYRLGRVTAPLHLGEPAYNRELVEGADMNGLCAAYQTAAQTGTLRPLAVAWSPPMLAYAGDLLARWSSRCGATS